MPYNGTSANFTLMELGVSIGWSSATAGGTLTTKTYS